MWTISIYWPQTMISIWFYSLPWRGSGSASGSVGSDPESTTATCIWIKSASTPPSRVSNSIVLTLGSAPEITHQPPMVASSKRSPGSSSWFSSARQQFQECFLKKLPTSYIVTINKLIRCLNKTWYLFFFIVPTYYLITFHLVTFFSLSS